MMQPQLVSSIEVDSALLQLPGWSRVGDELCCRYELPTFVSAVALTNSIAELAEGLQHHPEWSVAYRFVEIRTTTHDVGGISNFDLDLAGRIVKLVERHGGQPVAFDRVASRANSWVPPGHFYSPLVNVDEVRADADRLFASGLRDLPGVDLRVDAQMGLAKDLAKFYGEEDFPEKPRDGRRYCLDNEYFPYGDAFAYYALLRHVRPKRVIEIGAGWSSAVLLDTDERFLGNQIDCTFVEPYPERLQSLMTDADAARARLLQRRLQDVEITEFEALESGDFLFIDSSHVAKTGSDVLHAVFAILPRLATGVWVHFHDVHGNFEYPRAWVEEGRSWNENYFLRAFLMHNKDWSIELHAPTLAECRAEQLLPLMPNVGKDVGGSIWLRKVGNVL